MNSRLARTFNRRKYALARAIEELLRLGEWDLAVNRIIEVTVQEPVASHHVTIEGLRRWVQERDREDNVGVTALKRRVAELLAGRVS
jgi:hypothetical protein